MERRKFIKNAGLASSAALILPTALNGCMPSGNEINNINYKPISKTKKPLAIAMWDYTWILRHHQYGEFFDWDKALEDLAERGYNAIRMDAMPQFVVSEKDGKINAKNMVSRWAWQPGSWDMVQPVMFFMKRMVYSEHGQRLWNFWRSMIF